MNGGRLKTFSRGWVIPVSLSEIQARLRAAYQLADRVSSESGLGYLKHVVIDSRPDPAPFRLVAYPWQWERANRIVPALESLAGLRPDYSGPRSYAEIMPRGHDKTSFLARMLNWLLRYSRRKLTVIAAAGDIDQAGLISDAMRDEARWNPWLESKLRFQKGTVWGPGGHARIVAADAPTSFGLRGDLYLLDEVTHWKKEDFWVSLLSGRAKIPNALFVILSNAGLKNTWQWDLFQSIGADTSWSFWQAPGQMPTWMSAEQIARDRLLLPPAEARRLYDNIWIDPGEQSGYLTRAEVQACCDPNLERHAWGRNGIYYWLSIDYGPKRDRTTLGVYHQEPAGQLVVDRLDVWQGSPEQPVQISRIRSWIEEQRGGYPDCSLVVDPYQLEDLCQEYEHKLPVRRWEARGGKSNYELAAKLRSVIVNRQIAWYPGMGDILLPNGRADTLEDELVSLVLRPMVYGYRVDHELTKHDDRAVNMGMAVCCMLEQMRPPEWIGPDRPIHPGEPAPEKLDISTQNRTPLDGSQRDRDRQGSVVQYLRQLRGGTRRQIYGADLGGEEG